MSNSLFAITTLCRLLHLRVPAPEIQQALATHPAYPGLPAVRGVLHQWHVETLAVQVSEQQLPELSFPCVAYTTEASGPFVVLEGVSEGQVWLHRQGQGRRSVPLHDFVASWDGIVLLAEPEAGSTASAYWAVWGQHASLFVARLVLAMLGVGVLGAYLATTAHLPAPWLWAGLLGSKLFGSGVCVLLVRRSFGQSSDTLEKICSFHDNFDCDSVLNSSAARLTSWLSAAELGGFYFWGTSLVLLGAPFFAPLPTLQVLALLSLLTVPYAIFLVFYQRLVVRQWCTLCLLVQAALWAEVALHWLAVGQLPTAWSWGAAAFVGIGLLGTASGWLAGRSLLERSAKHQQLQQAQKRYSANVAFFDTLLRQQPAVLDTDQLDADLVFGEPEAPLVLTLIINPSCQPCRKLYLDADRLQRRLAGELCLVVRFSVVEQAGTDGFFVAQHLLRQPSIDQARAALAAWCSERYTLPTAWQRAFPADAVVEPAAVSLSLQSARYWCQQAGIIGTPFLFLNKQTFPVSFILADWEHFLWHKATSLPAAHAVETL
jgi:uncharacterized membrane protein